MGTKYGTFQMSRGWFDHPAFAPEPYTEREAWAWLISEAEWKPQKRKSGRKIIEVQRGQVTHSLRFIAKKWKWSKTSVDRFFKKLAAWDMIGTTTGTGQNVITLVNYGTYQNVPDKNGTAPSKKRDKLNTQYPTLKKGGVARAHAREAPDEKWKSGRKNGHEADRSITAAFDWLIDRINAGEPIEGDASIGCGEGENVVRLLPKK